MSSATLILRYAAFAILAMAANLLAQRGVLAYDQSPFGFAAALGVGTLVGLLVKYVLDKGWIFYDRATTLRSHGKKFSLYTATGVITTLIFWSTETVFWLVWHTEWMREIGAVVGLTLGYVVKYQLDRRYVFTDPRLVGRART